MRDNLINCGMAGVKYQASTSDKLEYGEHFFNITNGDKNGATEFKTYEKKKKTEW